MFRAYDGLIFSIERIQKLICMVHQTLSFRQSPGRRPTKRLLGVRASSINSRVQEVVQSVSWHHPQPRWHSRKRHDTKYMDGGCSVAACLYRWGPWLLSGRRSGEQRAKDGRYQATVSLRSGDKRSSTGQSGDCFRPMLDRSSVSVGRRWGVDCRPTLCRSQTKNPEDQWSCKRSPNTWSWYIF